MIPLDDAPSELQPYVAQIKHLHGMYLRYFVGRSHTATDRLLYHEIVNRLEACAKATSSVESLRAPLAGRLAALRQELAAVEAAHAAAATEVKTHAASLAAIANLQFLLYQRNFSGFPLSTRRPLLARRIAKNLTQVLTDMRAIGATTEHADNERNITIVAPMLEAFTAEMKKMESERDVGRPEIVRLLGKHLTAELVAYKKVKDTVTLDALGGYCDRVGELHYQMIELMNETEDSVLESTMRMATRGLDMLETDHLDALNRTATVTVAQVAESGPSLRAALACADVPDARRSDAIGKLDAFLQDPLVRQLVVDARQKR
ncbi:MAG: hypothetical protein AB7T06_15710 [Kofleriaceae bacterium]